jgi:hypothetical protein
MQNGPEQDSELFYHHSHTWHQALSDAQPSSYRQLPLRLPNLGPEHFQPCRKLGLHVASGSRENPKQKCMRASPWLPGCLTTRCCAYTAVEREVELERKTLQLSGPVFLILCPLHPYYVAQRRALIWREADIADATKQPHCKYGCRPYHVQIVCKSTVGSCRCCDKLCAVDCRVVGTSYLLQNRCMHLKRTAFRGEVQLHEPKTP